MSAPLLRPGAGRYRLVHRVSFANPGVEEETMMLADTMAIFFVILGLLLAFPSMWLLARALWPNLVLQASEDLGNGLWKSFLTGLPMGVVAFFTFAVLADQKAGGPANFTAIMIACLFLMFASAGVSGLATRIGERLLASSSEMKPPWKATLRGGTVLGLSYLLPFVGWFLVLPVSVVIGAGAALRSLLHLKGKCKGGKKDKKGRELDSQPVVVEYPKLDGLGPVGDSA